jgi:putative transposase
MNRDPGSERGWHSRGYLPHLDASSIVQFVTFRLADSLLRAVAHGIRQREACMALDTELDRGRGACLLQRPEIAAMVEASILHFDGLRYRLLAWCVMPNHVHVLVETIDGHPLGSIAHSWKSFTAKQAARMTGQGGGVWEPDYFDRYIRNHRQRQQSTTSRIIR